MLDVISPIESTFTKTTPQNTIITVERFGNESQPTKVSRFKHLHYVTGGVATQLTSGVQYSFDGRKTVTIYSGYLATLPDGDAHFMIEYSINTPTVAEHIVHISNSSSRTRIT